MNCFSVLQAEVQPCLLLNDRRKFHIRSYVLCVEQVHLEEGAGDEEELMKMYIYNRHEIRIASAPVSETEDPGNRDRSAHITQHGDISERRLLQDVPELVERKLQQKVELFAAQTFAKHLHSDIERRIALSASAMEEQNDAANGCSVLPHKFALAGLDLMVTEDDRIYLLEVNVNPGAPPAETVPVDVQDHLIGFLYDVVKVVTGGGSSSAMNFSSTDEILRRTI
jgi:Tubulin-tyrosine ligase family